MKSIEHALINRALRSWHPYCPRCEKPIPIKHLEKFICPNAHPSGKGSCPGVFGDLNSKKVLLWAFGLSAGLYFFLSLTLIDSIYLGANIFNSINNNAEPFNKIYSNVTFRLELISCVLLIIFSRAKYKHWFNHRKNQNGNIRLIRKTHKI